MLFVMPSSRLYLFSLAILLPGAALAAPAESIDCVVLMGIPEPGFYRDSCSFAFARPDLLPVPDKIIMRASIGGQLIKRWKAVSYDVNRRDGVTFSLAPLNRFLTTKHFRSDARVDLRVWLVFADGARREFVDDKATVGEYLPGSRR